MKKMSLAVKLDILIMAIVIIVSLVLLNITYKSYTKTVYKQMDEKLDDFEKAIVEGSDKEKEEGAEDSFEELKKYLSIVYYITTMDGFDEIAAETQKKQDYNIMIDWLQNHRFHFYNLDYMSKADYDARHQELFEQALENGYSEEDAYEWMVENDSEHYSYYSADTVFECTLGMSMQSKVNYAGINYARVYVEKDNGYMELAEIGGQAEQMQRDSLNIIDFEVYGKRYDKVEPIDVYKKNGGKKTVHFDSERRPEVAKVLEIENEGIKYYVVGICNATAAEKGRSDFLRRTLIWDLVMVIAAIAISLIILKRMAIDPLNKLVKATTSFAAGEKGMSREDIADLDIHSKDEIGELYREIRSMQNRIIDNTENIARMSAEKQRISTELNLATQIQADMLPNIFPAFPDRTDFNIYASMDPAKEVGGDFYDFFMVDDNHLALVIADVSGKGVPAALFMMISKIMLQDRLKTGLSPAEVLEQVNEEIMINNREEMFVTVWLGVLELSSGRLVASSAGHEYPFIKKPGESFEIFKDKHGFVVGSLPGIKYTDYELVLEPGSKLFVYTDGVPEATNEELKMFGTDRLKESLGECGDRTPEEILHHVRASVDEFVGEAEQFDDLTMLCIEYFGKK